MKFKKATGLLLAAALAVTALGGCGKADGGQNGQASLPAGENEGAQAGGETMGLVLMGILTWET